VNWRHRIAVVMLMCLAGLPLVGTVCAVTCLSGSSAVAAHHQEGQDCDNSISTPASVQTSESSESSGSEAKIGALSASHCGTHEAALPQVAATDVKRADLAMMAAPAASDRVDPSFGSVGAFDRLFQYAPPSGTAPPTITPLVLRV
jgi:hypothetical protein